MGRRRSVEKDINTGTWSKEEDEILFNFVTLHGKGKWRNVAKFSGLKRCAKSCRYRYMNYLKPDIKRGDISKEEQDLIIKLHHQYGNRWALIAKNIPGRTDIEIKNYWKIYLSKILHHRRKSKEEKAKVFGDKIISESSKCNTYINHSRLDTQTEDDDEDNEILDDFHFNDIGQDDEIVNAVSDSSKKIQVLHEEHEKVGRHNLKGAWSKKEDEILFNYVVHHGEGQWEKVAQTTGLKRCGKSCRHRYLHYLKPGIKRGNISKDEEEKIVRLHRLHGNRWALIAKELPGRRDSEIKNYWHAYLSKKSSPSVKINEPNSKARKNKKISDANAGEVHWPSNPNAEDSENNIEVSTESSDHNNTNAFSPNNSFQIDYDHAFLDDFLFNVSQNDQDGNYFNLNIAQIEDNNMVVSSSYDHQCQIVEDDLDFWTSSSGFPFIDC